MKATSLLQATQADIVKYREEEFAKMDADIVSMMNKAEKDIKGKQDALTSQMEPMAEQVVGKIVDVITGVSPQASDVKKALNS